MRQLRSYLNVGLLGLTSLCFGCTCERPAPLTADTFVGEYVFQLGDSGAPHHDPDRLTLKADGNYVLLHMPDGHPGSTEEGTWKLLSNRGQPQLAFGYGTYPVKIRGKRVRLLVNDDLDWYEKTR